jgi:hypothetical protein
MQIEVGPYRIIPGGISVSRTIGDLTLKDPSFGVVHSDQLVISEPECVCVPRHPDDQFVLLASDGFWDACPDNQTAVDLVLELLQERDTLAEVPLVMRLRLCVDLIVWVCSFLPRRPSRLHVFYFVFFLPLNESQMVPSDQYH